MKRRLPGRCFYCGRKISGKRYLACRRHMHLIAADPYYAPPDQWAGAR